MSVLAQIIIAIMKSLDGVSTPDANSSNSQFIPVYPNGQSHSYFRGGCKSVQIPPFWHGRHKHSFSLTHWVPDILKPAGQLKNWSIGPNEKLCGKLNTQINKKEDKNFKKKWRKSNEKRKNYKTEKPPIFSAKQWTTENKTIQKYVVNNEITLFHKQFICMFSSLARSWTFVAMQTKIIRIPICDCVMSTIFMKIY